MSETNTEITPTADTSVVEASTNAENPSVVADPSTEEGQSSNEGLLPEKFRGPNGINEMAKSYREMEKEFRSVQEERANLRKEIEAAKRSAPAQSHEVVASAPIAQTPVEDEDTIFMKEWELDPAKAVLNRNKRAEARMQHAVSRRAQDDLYDKMKQDKTNYPNFAEYEGEMIEVAKQYAPLLKPEQLSNPQLVPLLYNLVVARHLPDYVKKAEGAAADQAARARSKKNAAQAEGGSVARGSSSTNFSDLSLKEMEQALGFVDRD